MNQMQYIFIILICILFYFLNRKKVISRINLEEFTSSPKKMCCVFVSNKKYFSKFTETCQQLIQHGKYKGDICLVIGNDLKNNILLEDNLIKNNDIIIKYFPDIEFPDSFNQINKSLNTDGRNITKKFQWHKMYLFDTYFKQWDSIFYMDCGMKVLDDIFPMIKIDNTNLLYAHSDAYPTYERKLTSQFDTSQEKFYKNLSNKYNLNIDYFQTGILLYHTNIIEKDTFRNLINLAIKYPISTTNEQGIMNIYFNCQKKIWKQLKLGNKDTKFYDYWSRDKNNNKYIIVKVKNW